MSALSGIRRASHIGLCVAELDRSLAFYVDLLGFHKRDELQVDGPLPSQLLGLPDVALHAVYLERDGIVIELLHFTSPPTQGRVPDHPMNTPGFTHLSLQAENPATTLKDLRTADVPVLEETVLTVSGTIVAFFILDPDGQRIEITGVR